MKRLWAILREIYFSLPVQLVIVQVRYQKFVLLCWLILFLVITNNFGEALGIPYLLLEPEYLGEVTFFSTFLLGCGMGTFITSYMISSYISNSFRFHFLGMEYRPFFVFFINNMLLPFLFLVLYAICFIKFQMYMRGGFGWWIIGKLAGFYLGVFCVTILILIYFSKTNKNIVRVFGEKVLKEMKGRRVILEKARIGMGIRMRVDSYFSGFFKLVQPNPNAPADFRKLVMVINQNHGNALFLEFMLLLSIMGLGLLESVPAFQIPAGTSVLLLLSVLLMLVAAFTFWLRRLGPLALALIFVAYLLFDTFNFSSKRHPALGMDYETERVAYTPEALYKTSSEENIRADIANTIAMLDRWKENYQEIHGPEAKPRAIFVCASGGGLRSAYFTTRILQQLDSLTGGDMMAQTRLFTGASGGMIGASYVRELYLMHKQKEIGPIYKREFARRIGTDLLNRVAFKIVTGLFLPTATERVGDADYFSDRGWSFDDQLVKNLGVFEDRRLSDYIDLEEQAFIPQMIFSPVVINDGRKLYLSALPASYLMRNFNYRGELEEAITGIDFRRFFKEQDADSLLFVTAMRMNASFPIITPYVQLPSDPPMKVIDAGVADNYGLETASRYLRIFKDWFVENTSGVMLLQIRDSKAPSAEVPKYYRKSLLKQFLDPIGATYSAFSLSSDIANEQYLHHMDTYMEGKLDYVCFQYELVDSGGIRAALSWHLTDKEVEGIEESLLNEQNQAVFGEVSDWLEGGESE